MKLEALPREKFACLPTPVEELARLSRGLGRRIWIKRDDLTGLAMGGNKIRKLELLCADALAAGADTLITCGAPQSNHCRQTAGAAARLGLRCVLVLAGAPQAPAAGNLLLDSLLGAELAWAGETPRDEALRAAAGREQAAGRRPYAIPYGGSNYLGAAAYALAAGELAAQGVRPDWIVIPSSSAGTQSGLILGAARFGLPGRICGISIDLEAAALRAKISALMADTARRIEDLQPAPDASILVDDRFLGAGYGKAGALEREAIRRFAREEGIFLDPVYTGRAAGGMIERIRRGEIAPGETILFWHTGGTPALWAYAKELM